MDKLKPSASLSLLFIIDILLLISIITSKTFSQSTPYFQQKVFYEIHVTLDVRQNILLGHENLCYYNKSPDTLKYVWFHLYPNAYKDDNSVFAKEQIDRGINDFYYTKETDRGNISINNIQIKEFPVHWEYKNGDETEMKVFLPYPIVPGDSINFQIDFSVKIPAIISRLGHSNLHYEISQWYPKMVVYDNKGWHNDGYHFLGEFYGDFGTFNVTITLPENMRVAASGVLNDDKEKNWLNDMLEYTNKLDNMTDDKLKQQLDSIKIVNKQIEEKLNTGQIKLKTISFIAKNVHDFVWMCDYRYLVRKTTYLGTSIYIDVLPENYFAWKFTNKYAHDALEFMSKWYGPYIYPELNIVDSQNPYGGMEYPNLIQCSVKDLLGLKMLEQAVIHEIGHQWFYGMLGNNEMDDAWLDEGVTMFSEMRYFKEKYKSNFDSSQLMHILFGEEVTNHAELLKSSLYFISSFNPNLPPASAKAYTYRSRLEYSNIYIRPAFALTMLKYTIGDSLFNKAMQKYYTDNLLKHPNGKSLTAAFNEITQKDWQWYFDQWVYSNKQCDYKAGELISKSISGNNYKTKFEVIRADSIIMPLTVEFKTEKDSSIRKQIFADKKINVIEFDNPEKIISANIDPDRNLLEFNPRNNSTNSNGLRLKFILPTESFDQNTLFFTPWLGNTTFSGWGYGSLFLLYDRENILCNEFHILSGSFLYYPQIKNFDYSILLRSTTELFKNYNTYFLNYERWEGEINAGCGFDFRVGKYEFEHPSQNILLQFSYKDVFDERYYTPNLTKIGKDAFLGIRYTIGLDSGLNTHQFDLEVQNGFKILGSDFNYTKTTLQGYNDFTISKCLSITNFLSAGMINGNYLPQTSLFLSPSNKVIYSDFGSFVGHRYYYDETYSGGLSGYINENLNGKYLVSCRTDVNINVLNFPKMIEPIFVKFFGEFGKLWQSTNSFQSDNLTYWDAGIGLKIFGLDFSFPVWENYNVDKNGPSYSVKSNNHFAINSFLLRIDFTYYLKFGLGMK